MDAPSLYSYVLFDAESESEVKKIDIHLEFLPRDKNSGRWMLDHCIPMCFLTLNTNPRSKKIIYIWNVPLETKIPGDGCSTTAFTCTFHAEPESEGLTKFSTPDWRMFLTIGTVLGNFSDLRVGFSEGKYIGMSRFSIDLPKLNFPLLFGGCFLLYANNVGEHEICGTQIRIQRRKIDRDRGIEHPSPGNW